MTAYLSAFLIANLILSPGWVLLAVVAVVERRGER